MFNLLRVDMWLIFIDNKFNIIDVTKFLDVTCPGFSLFKLNNFNLGKFLREQLGLPLHEFLNILIAIGKQFQRHENSFRVT